MRAPQRTFCSAVELNEAGVQHRELQYHMEGTTEGHLQFLQVMSGSADGKLSYH
jgi:hypothetical protein